MKPRTTCRMLLLGLAMVGCTKAPIVIPGLEKAVVFEIHFAALTAAELGEVASFTAQFRGDDGAELARGALSFDAQSRTARWVEAPSPALDPDARFTLHLGAHDVTGARLPLGGAAGPVDLRDVDNEPLRLRALVSREDAFADVEARLVDPRFGALGVMVTETSLLVTGGATAGAPAAPEALSAVSEWIDVATGEQCASGGGCGLDEGPPARLGHLMLSLPTHLGCPGGGTALVGLGHDEDGPLDDLWLYVEERRRQGEPAFERVEDLALPARSHVAAAVLPGCRVVVAGGKLVDDSVTELVQVLQVDAVRSVQLLEESQLPTPVAGASVVSLDNQLGEVVFLGGYDDDGPVASANSFFINAGLLETCALTDGSCNGLPQSLRCPSSAPKAGLLRPGAAAAAVVLGSDDVACASVAELLVASETAPYLALTRLVAAPKTMRLAGFSISSLPGGALVVGGTGETGAVLPLAEVVEPAAPGDEEVAVGFRAVGSLGQPRSHHAAVELAFATVIAGGFDGSEPSASLEVFVGQGASTSDP